MGGQFRRRFLFGTHSHTHTQSHRLVLSVCSSACLLASRSTNRRRWNGARPSPFHRRPKINRRVCVCVPPPLQPSNTRACVLSLSLSHTDTDTLDRQALAFGVSFPGRSFFIIGPTLFVVVGSKSGGFFLLFSDAELCNGDRVFIDQGCGGGAWGCVCVCRRRN